MADQMFDDELKTKECLERQEEMDAIAAYGYRAEFPSVAGSYVQTPAVPRTADTSGVDRS